MKKKTLILMIGFLLIGVNLYAADGDFIIEGNVGIGTTSPNEQLEITGNFRLPTTTATAGIIYQGTERFIHSYTPPGETLKNFFLGANSGNFTHNKIGNVGIGANTLSNLSSSGYGDYNTAIGSNALFKLQNSNDNLAIGSGSLYNLTTGAYNVAVGTDALYFQSTGGGSIAIGGEALRKVYSAGNIGIGYQAGQNLKSSSGNTIIGYQAARPAVQPTTGNINNNVMIGYQTGYNLTDNSSGNVFIGYEAGYNETGSDKLYIANSSADPPLIYGDFSAGNVGIGTTDTQGYRLYVAGTAYSTGGWQQSSDIRFKRNIMSIGSALNKVLKLNGVSYEWKTDEYKYKGFPDGRHYGVIGQEIEKVLPEIVKEDSDGYKSVSYTEIIPVLIEAVKEQQRIIEKQQKEIEELKSEVKQLKT